MSNHSLRPSGLLPARDLELVPARRERSAAALGCIARLLFVAAALGSAPGCGTPEEQAKVPRPLSPDPIEFEYHGADGVVFTSEMARGRATAIALVTTYDLGSQLLLRRLGEAVRSHRPRVNAVAVVLEPPKYRVLLETFAETLELPFPAVLADYATREGRGPWGAIDVVPTLVVLDAQGRILSRHAGPLETQEILRALTEASPQRGVEP